MATDKAQSDRSIDGNYFNYIIDDMIRAQKFKNIIYLGAEYDIKDKPHPTKDIATLSIRLDHALLMVPENSDFYYFIGTDATITMREDRIGGDKQIENIHLSELNIPVTGLVSPLKEQVDKGFPQYKNRKLIAIMTALLPHELLKKYAKPEEEKYKMEKLIKEVQSGWSKRYACLNNAMYETQFIECLNYINSHNMPVSNNILRDAWQTLYSDYSYQPRTKMNMQAIKEDPKAVIYTAEHDPRFHTKAQIEEVLKAYGIQTSNKTHPELIKQVIDVIKEREL